jgi:hypothetical protein
MSNQPLTKTHPLFDKYIALACRLSPENLTCDGECKPAEVRRRRAQIAVEWRELDRQFGRPVTEDEIWKVETESRNY